MKSPKDLGSKPGVAGGIGANTNKGANLGTGAGANIKNTQLGNKGANIPAGNQVGKDKLDVNKQNPLHQGQKDRFTKDRE